MNIIKNDKVILMRPLENLQVVGETYEIANITETAVIIRDANTKVAVAAVDIDIFGQYFIKPEEAKSWTKWQRVIDNEGNTISHYRSNGKKVQVRTPDGYKSESCCHNADEFNLYFGMRLAFERCGAKMLKDLYNYHETSLNDTKSALIESKNRINRLINSIDKVEE